MAIRSWNGGRYTIKGDGRTREGAIKLMRILIVDDETLARDRLRRMIETDGQREVVADVASGQEAIKQSENCVRMYAYWISVCLAWTGSKQRNIF